MSKDFHTCALEAGFIAFLEGRMDDSDYIKRLAYEFYEQTLREESVDR